MKPEGPGTQRRFLSALINDQKPPPAFVLDRYARCLVLLHVYFRSICCLKINEVNQQRLDSGFSATTHTRVGIFHGSLLYVLCVMYARAQKGHPHAREAILVITLGSQWKSMGVNAPKSH